MGRVDIKLEMQNGQVKATVTADRPETLQMLKSDSSGLQQSLNNAGLNADANSLSFQLRGEEQQQQQQRQAAQSGANNVINGGTVTADDETASAALATTAARQRAASARSGVDINV